MAEAEELANQLAYEFLRAGRYAASSGPVELPWLAVAAAAAHDAEATAYTQHAMAFSGLSIQSVGFEEGTEDAAVHIYLTRGSARDMRALPHKIDDVPVKVHKIGAITVRPEVSGIATNHGNIFEKDGRICCGTSCGPTSEQTAGTIGAIVTSATDPGLFLLSNNHVFSGCNHVPFNQPILAPASIDGRPNARAPQEVGRHHRLEPLSSGDPHFVGPSECDVALARISDENAVSSWQGDQVDGFDTPTAIGQPRSLMRVKKFGRTTSLTKGIVEARVATAMAVNYNSKHFKGVVWFKDVWTVRSADAGPFALGGDSGSLVVTEDGNAAIGLLFAANPSGEYGWIIPMPSATGAFGGLQLVGGHGV